MTAPLHELLDDITSILRHKVMPQLEDDALRGELFAVIYMLNMLKKRADWLAEPLLHLIRAQDEVFDAVRPLLPADAAVRLPNTPRHPETLPGSMELAEHYEAGEALISKLLPFGRSGAHAREMEAALQRGMAAVIRLEAQYSAQYMMGEISSGRESA